MTTDLRAGRKALQNATQLLNAAISKGRHEDIARWLAMGAYYLGFLHCGGEISHKQYPFGETSDDPDEAMFLSAMGRAIQPTPARSLSGRKKPCPKCGSVDIIDASQSLDCNTCGHSW